MSSGQACGVATVMKVSNNENKRSAQRAGPALSGTACPVSGCRSAIYGPVWQKRRGYAAEAGNGSIAQQEGRRRTDADVQAIGRASTYIHEPKLVGS